VSGERRYPPGRTPNPWATPDNAGGQYDQTSKAVREVFTTYRTLDPIRAAALQAAVTIVIHGEPRPNESDTARATRVQHVATMFEAYLADVDLSSED
jgi:hypothetical protein